MRSKLLFGGLIAALAFLLATNPVVVNAAAKIGSNGIKNNAIKSKHIKNNNVKSPDIKNNTVTGNDVKESSLGAVPKTSQITSFGYAANAGDSGTVILNNFHGLTLTGSCAAGGATITANSSQTPAVISTSALVRNDPTLAGNNAFSAFPANITSPAGTVDTGNGAGTGFSNGQFVYVVRGTGTRVSVDWGYTGNFGFPNTCAFYGTAVGTTDGPAQVSRGSSLKPSKVGSGSAAGR